MHVSVQRINSKKIVHFSTMLLLALKITKDSFELLFISAIQRQLEIGASTNQLMRISNAILNPAFEPCRNKTEC